jgi:putative intracellular protease/amidase
MMSRFLCYSLLLVFCLSAQAKPRVALWNPEQGTTSSRFQIDLDWLNQIAGWLAESDVETTRLTAEQIEDTEQFSAGKFDALMLPGDAFPRRNTQALQQFAADGGILISLGAGPVPFLTAIENQGGTWTPSPVTPDKAWETSDIYHKVLGLVYNDVPARRADGVRHETTPLFRKYLPDQANLPAIEKKLPSRWLMPRMGATLYPLMRSKRADNLDTVPQLFVVQNKTPDATQTGLIAVSDVFTRAHEKEVWPQAKATVVALARIAEDLRKDTLVLTPDDQIVLHDEAPGDEE